jgi:hypothetical protein
MLVVVEIRLVHLHHKEVAEELVMVLLATVLVVVVVAQVQLGQTLLSITKEAMAAMVLLHL